MGEGTKVTGRRVFISGEEGGWERRAGCHTDGLFKPSVNGQADNQARSPLHRLTSMYFIVSSSIHRLDFLQYLPHTLPSPTAFPFTSIPLRRLSIIFYSYSSSSSSSSSSSFFSRGSPFNSPLSFKLSPSCRAQLQHSLHSTILAFS